MFCVIAHVPREPALASDPGECSADPDAGFDGAAEGAGDLRMACKTTAVRHRKLKDPQSGTGCPHLHLEVPAIGHLAHAEARQRVGADRPEGAHVCVPGPTDEADGGADDIAGERLVGSHASLLTHAAGA